MSASIYFIRDTVAGRIYVGSSRDCARRFSEHRSRLRRGVHVNAKLQAAWNKRGEAAFEFVVVASVLRPEWIEAVEQQFIDQLDAVRCGYNLAPTAGNTAGWRASDETRAHMSAAAKQRDHTVQVQAMAQATRGVKRPAHVIEAMQRGRRASPLSESSRARMAVAAVARSRYSQDQRRQMAEMIDGGATYRAVATHFGVTGHAAVMSYVKRWRAENRG